MVPETAPIWLSRLLQPAAFLHPTWGLRVLETHISWVILTGPFAYKVKKPVNLGFLDFSTLEQRRWFCLEELRLNRRLAPTIYLDVLPIVGSPTRPRVGGSGTAFEFAVKMKQFEQDALFSEQANADRLGGDALDALADRLAAFHREAPRAPANAVWGTLEAVARAVDENFQFLFGCARCNTEREELLTLQNWTLVQLRRLSEVITQRKAQGFVRECHGDLHLANVAWVDGEPAPFDCIEFNPELRWIDIISEVAFLTMDLEVHGLRALAYRFINRYAEMVGDYDGLRLWTLYRSYRALVRAKVARLSEATTPDKAPVGPCLNNYRRYLNYGLDLTKPKQPAWVITRGLAGSGKSTIAAQLAERLGAIRLRSDVERKRMAALPNAKRSDRAVSLYSEQHTRQTYETLRDLAETLIRSGISVVVDATFLRLSQRRAHREVARALGAGFWIVDVDAPEALLRERILRRSLGGNDPSDATLDVLEQQIRVREPLTG